MIAVRRVRLNWQPSDNLFDRQRFSASYRGGVIQVVNARRDRLNLEMPSKIRQNSVCLKGNP